MASVVPSWGYCISHSMDISVPVCQFGWRVLAITQRFVHAGNIFGCLDDLGGFSRAFPAAMRLEQQHDCCRGGDCCAGSVHP